MNKKHSLQKIEYKKKYGITCCKASSLFWYWAKQLLKEIKGFKQIANKHIDLNYRDFDKNIDKILEAFILIKNDESFSNEKKQKQIDKKIKKGLKLFAENFEYFWY